MDLSHHRRWDTVEAFAIFRAPSSRHGPIGNRLHHSPLGVGLDLAILGNQNAPVASANRGWRPDMADIEYRNGVRNRGRNGLCVPEHWVGADAKAPCPWISVESVEDSRRGTALVAGTSPNRGIPRNFPLRPLAKIGRPCTVRTAGRWRRPLVGVLGVL